MDSTIIVIISAVSAIAAAVATIAAWRTVKVSYKGVKTQILLHLRTEFSSQLMYDALCLLSEFKKEHSEEYKFKFRELKEKNGEEFKNLNNARRVIKGYYLKVYYLSKADIIRSQDIKSLISDIQFDFMLDILESFEEVIAVGKYDDYLFQWASKIR